ncbi:hypothetical protein JKP88DRAFT_287778 [Tribonema minus]|uniref:RING-type domain-containing protein n=1 Tax=Tribonema minus TaxID=303371 RepID=A0A835ZD37_9STRA|nr:hypothetical protein JKP88DRAFT_287778 [Tribonema minus]
MELRTLPIAISDVVESVANNDINGVEGDKMALLASLHLAEGDKMALLACRHAMHLTCVRPWLASHDTCPVCKIDLHDVHTRARRALSQRSTTPWNHGDRDDAAAEAALALVAAFSDSDSDSREGQLSADMSLLEGVAAISGQGCGGGGGGGREGACARQRRQSTLPLS